MSKSLSIYILVILMQISFNYVYCFTLTTYYSTPPNCTLGTIGMPILYSSISQENCNIYNNYGQSTNSFCFNGTLNVNQCWGNCNNCTLTQYPLACNTTCNVTLSSYKAVPLGYTVRVTNTYNATSCNPNYGVFSDNFYYENCFITALGSQKYSCVFGFGVILFNYTDANCQSQNGWSIVNGCQNGINSICYSNSNIKVLNLFSIFLIF